MFFQYKQGETFKFPHYSRWWNDSTANENLFNNPRIHSTDPFLYPRQERRQYKDAILGNVVTEVVAHKQYHQYKVMAVNYLSQVVIIHYI